MSSFSRLLDRQLHFVSGKGGVGKSVVAAALALRFVHDGQRTLLVQVNAQDSHSRLLDIPPVTSELREPEKNLVVVNTNPADSLREYALMTLKLEALYKAVFENRLTKTFLRFVPSVAELTMLGKIWFHATETDARGNRRYPRIVVDCPSTGHGLQLLRTAQIIHDTARVGPMAEKTAEMARLIADRERSVMHIVAIPEELPVNEGLELLDEVKRTQVVPPGALFLNRMMPRLFGEGDARALTHAQAAAAQHVGGDDAREHLLSALLDVGERRKKREHDEREQEARLAGTALPLITFPLILAERLQRSDVERFAQGLPS